MYESASGDDYNDQEHITGAEDDVLIHTRIVSFHSRPVRPLHVEIRSINPTNKTVKQTHVVPVVPVEENDGQEIRFRNNGGARALQQYRVEDVKAQV